MAEDSPARGDPTSVRRARPSAQWGGRRVGDHRDDALGDLRLGRGRVAARPLAGDRVFILVGTLLGLTVAIYLVVVKYGSSTSLRQVRPDTHHPGRQRAGHRRRPDAEGTTVTSSAVRAPDVLAAEVERVPRADRRGVLPRAARTFDLLGIDFEITRITLILWVATAL